jgi:tetratricopeptide (TPR) repeat protein
MMAELGMTDVTDGFRRARGDAERAIALDPTSAPGYLAFGWTQISYDWDWDTANTCLTKAVALEPGSVDVLRFHSTLSAVLSNLEEAVKLDEQAAALDPLRANSYLNLGYLLYLVGRYNEAQAALHKALELNPQAAIVHGDLGKILIAEAKPQQALAEFENEPTEWAKLTGEALAYHALGRERDSNTALARLIANYGAIAAYQIAEVYAFRGESDNAFESLERAYKQRDPGLPKFKTDPLLKTLRHDARYIELLKKMRLST